MASNYVKSDSNYELIFRKFYMYLRFVALSSTLLASAKISKNKKDKSVLDDNEAKMIDAANFLVLLLASFSAITQN